MFHQDRSIVILSSILLSFIFLLFWFALPANAIHGASGQTIISTASSAIVYGQTITGAIATPGQVISYTFSAGAGDTVLLRLGDDHYYFDPELRLYDPAGDLIASVWSSGDFAEITQTLPAAGVYSVWVGDYGGSDTANYGLSLNRLNPPVGAVSGGYGESWSGSIALMAELDGYTFSANAGDRILIRLGDSSYYFDPELRLYNPAGDLIALAWSSGDFAEITQTLTTAGDYSVWVGDNGGTDAANYGLSLNRLNPPVGAVSGGYGESWSGSIALMAELDGYTFSASAGDRILIRLGDDHYYFDPELRLYDPDGELVASAWSSGDYVEITGTLATAGEYSVWVGDNGGTDTANYGLSLNRMNPPVGAVSGGYGESWSGSIALMAELDGYTFTASAGDRILIRLGDNGYYFDPELRLYNPTGELVASAWSSGDYVEITGTLATAGAYSVWVGDSGGTDTANYALSLYRMNDPVGAISIGYGETKNGTIDPETALDAYTFTANAGDLAWIRLSDDSYYFDPELRLSSLDGSMVNSASSSGDYVEILQTIPITATYAIWVGDSGGDDTANYVLSLSGGDTELPLPIGVTQEIQVFSESPLTYRIELPDGAANLFVTLQKYDSWSGSLALYDGATLVASSSGNSDQILHVPSPAAQSYRLAVTGSGRARLTADTALPELTLGEWQTGTILHAWGSAWYQYTVPDGQSSLFINVETIGLWSQLKVYHGALGSTPYWSASGSVMNLEIPAPAPGIYYVHLSDSAWIVGEDQTRDHLIRADVTPSAPPPCTLPTIASFTPAEGGTAGPVTIQMTGQCLDPLSSVSLRRDGYDPITATQVTGSVDGQTLNATFDLATTAPGEWALWATNPDSQSSSALTPFTVARGGEAELWVEIIGRETIRAGRQQTIYISYGNSGNIDAQGVPLWIDGIPSDAIWALGIEIRTPPPPTGEPTDWEQVPIHVEMDDQILIPLLIPSIPPGYTGEIPLNITIPTTREVQLRARMNPVGFLCSPTSPGDKCISGLLKKAIGVLPGASCVMDTSCWFYNYVLAGSAPGDIDSMFRDMVMAISTCAGDLNPLSLIVNTVGDLFSGGAIVSDCYDAVVEALFGVKSVMSISPEDKFGPSGYDAPDTPAGELQRWIPADRELDYRIDFWNKEDAPAATADVIITDTLDTDLDWDTFRFTDIGFLDWPVELEPTQYFNVDVENVRIDLSPYYPGAPVVTMTVNVEGIFDPATGKIQWIFHALEPGTFDPPEEPLAGFLPPITDAGWEIGWVGFSVAPRAGLASGTVISNQSFVKFDLNPYNPAPPGGPYLNTLDAVPPASAVLSPATAPLCNSFWVSWTGQDETGGSGLDGFDVYVNDLEDSALAYVWLLGASTATESFTGLPGHRYGFYTRARDHAGNSEPAPEPLSYDAQITAGSYCTWLPVTSK